MLPYSCQYYQKWLWTVHRKWSAQFPWRNDTTRTDFFTQMCITLLILSSLTVTVEQYNFAKFILRVNIFTTNRTYHYVIYDGCNEEWFWLQWMHILLVGAISDKWIWLSRTSLTVREQGTVVACRFVTITVSFRLLLYVMTITSIFFTSLHRI